MPFPAHRDLWSPGVLQPLGGKFLCSPAPPEYLHQHSPLKGDLFIPLLPDSPSYRGPGVRNRGYRWMAANIPTQEVIPWQLVHQQEWEEYNLELPWGLDCKIHMQPNGPQLPLAGSLNSIPGQKAPALTASALSGTGKQVWEPRRAGLRRGLCWASHSHPCVGTPGESQLPGQGTHMPQGPGG